MDEHEVNVPPDQAKLRPRQDPVLIIDATGIHSVVNGVRICFNDGRGLIGISVQCQLAYMERERQAALDAKDQAISLE